MYRRFRRLSGAREPSLPARRLRTQILSRPKHALLSWTLKPGTDTWGVNETPISRGRSPKSFSLRIPCEPALQFQITERDLEVVVEIAGVQCTVSAHGGELAVTA